VTHGPLDIEYLFRLNTSKLREGSKHKASCLKNSAFYAHSVRVSAVVLRAGEGGQRTVIITLNTMNWVLQCYGDAAC